MSELLRTDLQTIISEIESKFEVYDKIVIFYLILTPDLGIFNGNYIFSKSIFRKIPSFIKAIDTSNAMVRINVEYFVRGNNYIELSEQFEKTIT
ncbi:hypothetical protein ND861_07135 [Leptospira sp. 2 VSF19]|uniref:Uncharacterized protein n=1 Tax=Leptospira soteropolitanensis TaxID=2950025 RepID=A0AAW5VJM1_9LEPT|nr:hypothetical protein [Leptospira soteropolitanensis]MCW7494665.1 hypothetical protein [Leptospira soteropolitanensis]MCW7500003.1 hypothetical protein [Leptospira soteropolitanensis]MCW7522254.1 hypothetical protein [Leptospira soteropolitanensis]MCW7526110.1 hypothetical protein [Leptospira soteropolitanensis]MCW7529778.1 hypothetical protein [Leptospira soteropolitanensis]